MNTTGKQDSIQPNQSLKKNKKNKKVTAPNARSGGEDEHGTEILGRADRVKGKALPHHGADLDHIPFLEAAEGLGSGPRDGLDEELEVGVGGGWGGDGEEGGLGAGVGEAELEVLAGAGVGGCEVGGVGEVEGEVEEGGVGGGGGEGGERGRGPEGGVLAEGSSEGGEEAAVGEAAKHGHGRRRLRRRRRRRGGEEEGGGGGGHGLFGVVFGGDWVRCRRRHPLLKTWGSSTRAQCQVLESSSPRSLDDRVELELKLELYYRLLHSLDQLVH